VFNLCIFTLAGLASRAGQLFVEIGLRLLLKIRAARSISIASRRFDFPDAFGPISTFSGASSIASESGRNDNNPVGLIDLKRAMLSFRQIPAVSVQDATVSRRHEPVLAP
jgi:hypothetical protein